MSESNIITLVEPVTIKRRVSGQAEHQEEEVGQLEMRDPTLADLSGVPALPQNITMGHLVEVAAKCCTNLPPETVRKLNGRNLIPVANWATGFIGAGQ